MDADQNRLTRSVSPSLSDKLRRALWQLSWLVLYRPTPVPFHAWRRFILRCFGATVGAGAHPYPSARIWAPWNLEMGDGSCLAAGIDCYNVARVTLGKDSIVSQRAYLCSASHDFRDPSFPLLVGPIAIGENAWVATDAFIGPGTIIGDGAVIGARAVVTRDVAANKVVAGNPATEIGTR